MLWNTYKGSNRTSKEGNAIATWALGVSILAVIISVVFSVINMLEGAKSNRMADKANEIAESAKRCAKEANDIANKSNAIASKALEVSVQPYVAINCAGAGCSNKYEIVEDGKKKDAIRFSSKFLLYATLPANIVKWDIYLYGGENRGRPIKGLYNSKDKPIENFVLDNRNKSEVPMLVMLKQDIDAIEGDVSDFETAGDSLALFCVEYQDVLGNKNSNYQWLLFRFKKGDFGGVESIRVGMNRLSDLEINQLFLEQQKKRDSNTAY
ncbi:MAG TPA: hypothetical protein PKY78_09145 [Candidatus Omnitrophota bacterium]|nr:hypothetical protein [Candidatus Omnitrophota bacterium]